MKLAQVAIVLALLSLPAFAGVYRLSDTRRSTMSGSLHLTKSDY